MTVPIEVDLPQDRGLALSRRDRDDEGGPLVTVAPRLSSGGRSREGDQGRPVPREPERMDRAVSQGRQRGGEGAEDGVSGTPEVDRFVRPQDERRKIGR